MCRPRSKKQADLGIALFDCGNWAIGIYAKLDIKDTP